MLRRRESTALSLFPAFLPFLFLFAGLSRCDSASLSISAIRSEHQNALLIPLSFLSPKCEANRFESDNKTAGRQRHKLLLDSGFSGLLLPNQSATCSASAAHASGQETRHRAVTFGDGDVFEGEDRAVHINDRFEAFALCGVFLPPHRPAVGPRSSQSFMASSACWAGIPLWRCSYTYFDRARSATTTAFSGFRRRVTSLRPFAAVEER